MMNTILYVDDNPQKISSFKKEFSDFKVISFDNPLEASKMVEDIDYDILVLDIMMPFLDGFELLAKMKKLKNYSDQPTFFLSETNDESLMIKALELGVEDLLTADMSWQVKKVRIKSRLTPKKDNEITFNFIDRTVELKGVLVELTTKELQLLHVLSERRGMNKDDLVAAVWGEGKLMVKNNLSTHISNLNKKIHHINKKVQSRKGIVSLI
ncbi:MAG: response regulator transcription factor [Bdellovibrionota bacterium]|nr:response regulator transcription factor [Bdellovibrionota bacterium]